MSKNNKILVILTEGLPSKETGASTVIFYQFINYLLKKNKDVHILAILKKNIKKKEKKKFLDSFKKRQIKSYNQVIYDNMYNHNKYNILLKNIDTKRLDEKIIDKIKNINPKKILALDITAGSFAKQIFKKNIYVWLGDLNYRTFWYHFYYNYKNTIKYYFYYAYVKLIISKWKYFYKKVLYETKNISGSNINIKDLNNIGIKTKYHPYPWPINNKNARVKKEKKPSFVFFGNLSGLGSKSAINYLISKIYPKFTENWGSNGFKIYICGTYKFNSIYYDKIKELKNIKLMGFVKNINDLVLKCHGCLFPIDVPVGNRSRIVTAMGSRWPIIAHINVSLGNPSLKSGYNCFLAKNIDEFLNYSRTVFEKDGISKKITANAYKSYKINFSPDNSLKKFSEFINE